MERIKSFYLPQLHNGESANFHHESLEQLEKSDPSILGVSEQILAYHSVCEGLDRAIDVYMSSDLSIESTRRDGIRVRAYSAFKAYVKVYLNDENEEIVEAAEHVIAIIRSMEREHGNPVSLGLVKGSTALLSLLRNLEPYSADIERIGATARLKKLAEANQSFIDLQFERYTEKSEKPSGDVKAARAEADAIYKDIVNRINAQILLTPNEAFTPYVKTQNAIIDRYRLIVAQRKGRATK
ncbi:MAG: DUF6261 family protein [Bacteroidales bacterium]|jgi:hypothetical protein|nr:DUF6261 family protein [Bacteroidales bacterium]